MFVCVRTGPSRGVGRGQGVGYVFVCNNEGGGGATLRQHAPKLQPVAPIQYRPHFACPIDPITGGKPYPMQSSSLSLPPHPPPLLQDERDEVDDEVDGFGSGGEGGVKKKKWKRNDPPRHQCTLQ